MNMKTTDYMLVTGTTDGFLELHVKEYLAEGWEPIGGVIELNDEDGFMQAMIKREPATAGGEG